MYKSLKNWNCQSEAKLAQIIAIVKTYSVFLLFFILVIIIFYFILGVRITAPMENCPPPRSESGFGIGLALELRLGTIFLAGGGVIFLEPYFDICIKFTLSLIISVMKKWQHLTWCVPYYDKNMLERKKTFHHSKNKSLKY